jgi:hypothetical protein
MNNKLKAFVLSGACVGGMESKKVSIERHFVEQRSFRLILSFAKA